MPEGKLKPASANPMAKAIREAIGAGPDDEVTVVTPQFTRPRGATAPASPPADPGAWEALRTMDAIGLRELGLGSWDGGLFLFPAEWYEHIPAGLEVEDIFGEREPFVPGETDDSMRFGCLPYGVRIGPATDEPGGDR